MTCRPSLFRLLGVGAVGLAAFLSLAGVPITSAQGETLFAVRADGSLPVDAPFDPLWESAPPLDVVMSGQTAVTPRLLVPSVASVRARAMVDDTRFAVLLEWDDATLDDSVLGVDTFADAAAVQLALGSGTSVCMGQQAGGLNIWHWKADWAADLAAGGRRGLEDVHPGMPDDVEIPTDDTGGLGPDGFVTAQDVGNLRAAASLVSSVEDLDAVGFGTLTSQPLEGQNVRGASEHRDGVWRVVMSRDLTVDDPNDAVLRPGGTATVVAFAVWEGSRGDRNGQKSVSTWLALALPEPRTALADDPRVPALGPLALVVPGA